MRNIEAKEYFNHGLWVDYVTHNMSSANITKSTGSEVTVVTANNGDTLARFNESEGYGFIFESRKSDKITPLIRRASDF